MCFYSLVAGIGQVRTYTAGVSQSMEDGGCACRTRHRYVKQNYHLYVSMTRLNRYNEISTCIFIGNYSSSAKEDRSYGFSYHLIR